MRFYKQVHKTPAFATESSKVSDLPQRSSTIVAFESDVNCQKQNYSIESCRNINHPEQMTFSKCGIQQEKAFQSPERFIGQEKIIPSVTKSVTSTTASTSDSSPVAKDFPFISRINKETKNSFSESVRDLQACCSSGSFHFDIEIVKRVEKRQNHVDHIDRHNDDLSRASSSTLTTRLSQDICLRKPAKLPSKLCMEYGQRQRFNVAPLQINVQTEDKLAAQNHLFELQPNRGTQQHDNVKLPHKSVDDWSTPLFFEQLSHGDFTDNFAQDRSHSENDVDELSWIEFGDFNSFRPIDPVQLHQKAEILARPVAREALNLGGYSGLTGTSFFSQIHLTDNPQEQQLQLNHHSGKIFSCIRDCINDPALGQPGGKAMQIRDGAFLPQMQDRNQVDLKVLSQSIGTQWVSTKSRKTPTLVQSGEKAKQPRDGAFLSQVLQKSNQADLKGPSHSIGAKGESTTTRNNSAQSQPGDKAMQSRDEAFLSHMLQERNQANLELSSQQAIGAKWESTNNRIKQENSSSQRQQKADDKVNLADKRSTVFLEKMILNRIQTTEHSAQRSPGSETQGKKTPPPVSSPIIQKEAVQEIEASCRLPIDSHKAGKQGGETVCDVKANLLQMLHKRALPDPKVAALPIDNRITEKKGSLSNSGGNGILQMLQKRVLPEIEGSQRLSIDNHEIDEIADTSLTDDDLITMLTCKQEFAKYNRMLKVGLPLPTVLNAMERDGVHVTPNVKAKRPSSPQDPIQRFRIHWQPHNNIRSNTMWAMIGREDHWLKDLSIDKEEIKILFEKERNQHATAKRNNPSASEGNCNTVHVIESKRANNCGIILARIKLTYREIATAIDNVDGTKLSLEQINGIAQYLPTKEEASALRDHMKASPNQPFRVECEKFMAEMLRVSDVQRKVEAMLFIKRLPICIDELKNDAHILQRACEEIMSSSSLRKILGAILYFGNECNTTGPKPKDSVSAIQLVSLLKLNQAKTFDKKTTFLEYVARILRRNCPDLLLQYRQDLATLCRAEKIQWIDTVAELEALDEKLTEVRRLALQSAKAKSLVNNSRHSSTNNLDADFSSDDEVHLLQSTPLGRFTFEACLQMASIYAEVEAAKTVFGQLAHYFGEVCQEESSDKYQPQEIVRHLSKFCNDLDMATERAIVSEKARTRELRTTVASSRRIVAVKPRAKARFDGKATTKGMKGLLEDLNSRRLSAKMHSGNGLA